MATSIAYVATDAAARYAKQLASHLGRKLEAEELPDGGYRLTFSAGEGVLTPEADRLVMRASAADAESLGVVQDVLGRHLERFGQRNELTVTWE
ncbi:DUF2218 domain-containing protein [Microtetraspora sp. AC03309]|uniref:DUF2218 domain-containing protein n=1 Tax=Microtetraspora sp. AC03309 TaxID=2779376 RepID=UPI001E3BD321|nr:DUF2218 domain-containing protein [Microtetraspora sp. AC03309]MCC5575722.1 DUF2218 domain-containing protein [Microtetraspora sp. AC03309]